MRLRLCGALATAALALAAAPAAAQDVDECPNGWSPEESVAFGPPVPEVDSGVGNAELPDGCTLLDDIWAAEPFPSHRAFVQHVARTTKTYVRRGVLTERERARVRKAAKASEVGTAADVQLDNSCNRRVAITFDDGVSAYRPETLRILREKQVHGVFYDNGFRIAANPHIPAFQYREGHTQLNHTYWHPHLNQLSDAAIADEVLDTHRVLEAAGAGPSFLGFRPPFFEADERVLGVLEGLGYTVSRGAVGTDDWDPATTAEEIRDDIMEQLEPGSVVLLHDGPSDTPAGAASVAALAMLIDDARAAGFCFGVTDRTGEVVASRYVSSGERIPEIVNPVPYNVLVRPGTPPDPYVFVESRLGIEAGHAPATFVRGGTGTLELTVTNVSDEPTDDSTVTVTDAMPAGLTATAAAGEGWTCSVEDEVTCTRAETLAAGASYPPVTISVTVAADAPDEVTHAPRVVGHGQVWQASASDAIAVTSPG